MIRNIHLLRAAATLMVVIFHFADEGFWPGGTWLPPVSRASINFLFLMSGYLMVVVSTRGTGGIDFMRRRLCRVAPAYWLVTLLLFALSLHASDLVTSRPTLLDLGRSLLFIPYQRPNGLMQPVLFIGWTINMEIAFYTLIAVSTMIRPRTWRWPAVAGVVLAAFAVGLAPNLPPVVAFYTQPTILCFVLGVGMAVRERDLRRMPAWSGWGALALGLAVCIFGPLDALHLVHIFGAFLIMLGLLVLEFRGWSQRIPGVMRLGDISYSVFLVHALVGHIVLIVVHKLRLSPTLFGPVALLAVIGVSMLAHDRVEKPLTDLAMKLTGARRKRPPEAGPATAAG